MQGIKPGALQAMWKAVVAFNGKNIMQGRRRRR
jgi:hypothetical protein